MNIRIHTDGGARGNPGPAAVGVVIEEQGSVMGKARVIAAFGKTIGETTNNVAEYTAVIEALRLLLSKKRSGGDDGKNFSNPAIQFFLDSTLVVNQLNGLFKVKLPHLRELLFTVRQLEEEVGGDIRYAAIPREQNTHADMLVNQALDASR